MHINKHFLFVIGAPALLVLTIALAGAYRANTVPSSELIGVGEVRVPEGDALIDPMPTDRLARPDTPVSSTGGTLAADTFTGVLTKVDTGCFADGECYIEVDGTHVTVLMGWSQETVGTVQGVPGFGDLEAHIGEPVEVYAQRLAPGNYTLYGSEGFYVRLAGSAADMPGQTEPGSTGSGVSGSVSPFEGIAVGEPHPTAPRPEPTGGCIVGGCSGQLCVDASVESGVSTCEWNESYACYQSAQCGRQASGECGWTESPALKQCLDGASSASPLFLVQ